MFVKIKIHVIRIGNGELTHFEFTSGHCGLGLRFNYSTIYAEDGSKYSRNVRNI